MRIQLEVAGRCCPARTREDEDLPLHCKLNTQEAVNQGVQKRVMNEKTVSLGPEALEAFFGDGSIHLQMVSSLNVS
jgi:hypothetical protein